MMFSCCHPRLPEDVQVALDPQHPVRLRRDRDRERVPGRPRGDREAHLARQEGARRAPRRLFDLSDAEFTARLSAVQARAVPAVQRGLSRCVRRIRGPRRAVHRGDAPDGAAARVSAGGGARDRCARRADVSPRRAAAGAPRLGGRSESAPRPGPIALGRSADRAKGWRCSSARRRAAS